MSARAKSVRGFKRSNGLDACDIKKIYLYLYTSEKHTCIRNNDRIQNSFENNSRQTSEKIHTGSIQNNDEIDLVM